MAFDINAEIRKFTLNAFGAAKKIARMTQAESLAIAQVEPPDFELTRAGRRFEIGIVSGITGIAPVQTLPTTAAQWLLYNTHPTRSAVIDWLGVLLVSGTAGAGIVLLGGLVGPGTLPTTPPSANNAGIKVGPNANGLPTAPNSAVVVASAQTLVAAPTNGWRQIAKGDSANTAVLSVAVENRDIKGKIVIPPGQGLALAVLSPAGTTPLYAPVGSWAEIDATLE